MLVARSLRVASISYVRPSYRAWPSKSRTLPMLRPTVIESILSPLAASYSKDAKAAENLAEKASNLSETPSKSNIPEITLESSDKNTKTKAEECSTGAVADVGVKLPSRDQVESFLFKSLVYFWDFAYYTFCLCRNLIDVYVVKNATVQTNWKQLLKRMEDARKDIKSK